MNLTHSYSATTWYKERFCIFLVYSKSNKNSVATNLMKFPLPTLSLNKCFHSLPYFAYYYTHCQKIKSLNKLSKLLYLLYICQIFSFVECQHDCNTVHLG